MQKRFTPDEGGVFPEWEEKTLGECMTLIASKGYKGKDLVNDEDKAIMFSPSDIDTFGVVFLVKNAHISDELFKKSKEALAKNGDILFTKTASIGKVGYVKNLDHNATINPQIVILRANENVDSYFLFCAVRTEAFKKQVHKISGGTTIKTMSQEALKKLKIKIPKSIEEQRKIAAALAAYDEMIAVKTAKLETWQECKKRMVKEIFGRTKRFRDDDGNEFPEWEEKTLGEVAELKNGFAFSAKSYDKDNSGDYRIITIGNLQESKNIVISNKTKTVLKAPENIKEHQVLKNGDILVALTGATAGRVALNVGINNLLNQRVGKLQIKDTVNVDNEFLYHIVSQERFEKEMKKKGHGSAQPNLSKCDVEGFSFSLPCIEEQQKIGSFLAEIDKEIEIQKEFIKTYAEGKKRMMRELMEG